MIRLPAGRSSTSTPASCSFAVGLLAGLDEPEPALATGEERGGDLLEVAGDGLEGLGEAPLHGLGELVAQLRDLGERRLQILPLRRELLEALLLLLVLLLASGLTLPSASRRASRRSVRTASSLRSSPSAGSSAAASSKRRWASSASASSRASSTWIGGRALRWPRRRAVAPRPRPHRAGAAPRRAGPSARRRRRRGPAPEPRGGHAS